MKETKEQKIENLLSRNVADAISAEHIRTKLLAGKKLRVKLGIDPTSSDIHLGHAVVLRKMREYQDLGCKAVLIIGDFTARIGDPSGRDKTRPPLTEKQIKENLRNYLKQAGKVIDLKKAEVAYNRTWLGKLNASKMLELLASTTLQRIIEREDFGKRLAEHAPIRMHELIYPLMQGYDSIAVKADVELGGTDQTFNLLAGRDLMEHMGLVPQDIMTSPLLEGTDGVKKMSKSLGNYIGLDDAPEDMFGKIMSVPDILVQRYFMLCTELEAHEINELCMTTKPKELKERLGVEIVKLYHGEKKALAAREAFEKVFSRKEVPENLPPLTLEDGKTTALSLSLASNVFKSRSEARRLIEQGGLEINGQSERDPIKSIEVRDGQVVRIGKKRFFKIKIK